MSMPVFVEPTLTLEHTKSVSASAWGIERISSSSDFVMLLLTRAEYPPRKLTPAAFAASSRAWHSRT